MKTNNFAIDLMVPGQIEKDIIFNESILLIDQFLNNSVNGFIKDVPDSLEVGEKFIILNGDKKNHICFLSHNSKSIEFLTPSDNTVVFSKEHKCFFLFDKDNWIKINTGSSQVPVNFTGISESYTVPVDIANHYLYLSEDCAITLTKTTLPEITIIIKQNASSAKTLNWPDNILWENNSAHIITTTTNRFDIVKLFRLPESNHFLGKIVSQNHKF
ncbi:MAG: hypothetical protein NWP47_00755 [Rickettsiaceae bacterium]|nr:hypothetical protein [Rickettsiaceae bacterium]